MLLFDKESIFFDKALIGTQLSGGLSNKTYSFQYDGKQFLYKKLEDPLYGYQNRRREKILWQLAANANLTPDIIEWSTKAGYVVMPYLTGWQPTSEPTKLEWSSLLKQLHQIELPNNIPDFSPSATIEHHLNRLALSEKARTMQEIYEKIKSKDLTPGPRVICHLDLFQSNILISPKGELQLIDWEYSAPAPYYCDIAHFITHIESGWKSCKTITKKLYPHCWERALADINSYLPTAYLFWTIWCIIQERRTNHNQFNQYYQHYLKGCRATVER